MGKIKMVEYKPGVEKVITRDSLIILAIVYSLRENNKVVVEKKFDYSKYEDRKELGALSFWAYKNHCSIETIAMSDAEAEMEEVKND